jgi:ribosome biogenesis GTPase
MSRFETPRPPTRRAVKPEPADEPGVWGEVIEMVGKRVRVRLDPSDSGEGGEHVFPVRAKVAISDRVRVHDGAVVAFQPRTAELMRSGLHKTQVVCANASMLVMVVAAREPPFRAGLIDRVLVAAGAAGMKASIVLNKCDQGMPSEVLEKLARYEALGYPIFLVSALQQKGLDELTAMLSQHTSVFVGHSGVGKTSLLQVIVPGVVRDIGVLDQWGRGRHTTIAAVRFDLPGGGRVIDVPGVREFGLEHIDRENLHRYFPELAELRCKFRDCMHMGEDGCLAEDACTEERLESYQKLVEELV